MIAGNYNSHGTFLNVVTTFSEVDVAVHTIVHNAILMNIHHMADIV